jgi:outer membrane protein OmpA-like peptidoglycan-associated protein
MSQFDDKSGTPKAKRGLSPVIIIASVALVIAFILIVWLATRGPKTSTLTASPSPTESVAPSPSVKPSPSPVEQASPSPSPVASEWTTERLESIVKENTPIYFVKDSARLLPGEKQKVVRMAEAMSHYKNVMLKFRGHTAAFNLPIFRYELSVRRALTVRWLFEYRVGYDLTAVEIRGLGSTELVKKGDAEADRAPNRRVEVIVQHAEPRD